MIDLRRTFPATDAAGGYHARLRDLRGEDASGVYVIIDTETRAVLYVGESHSGRLYDTITRHFRAWAGRTAGTTYDRDGVDLVIARTSADRAIAAQEAAIAQLDPRDNTNSFPEDDDAGPVPF